MKKIATEGRDVLAELKLIEQAERSARLAGAAGTLEIAVLGSDVFRLRAWRRKQVPTDDSWAVIRREFGSVAPASSLTDSTWEISTGECFFRLTLENGAWSCGRRDGKAIVAEAGGMKLGKQQSSVALRLAAEDRVFGLGESTGTGNKRGLIREFWNIDVLGHAPCVIPSLRNLYASIPLAYVVEPGAAVGLFWDSPARQVWDVGQTEGDRWHLTADTDNIDLYLFVGSRLPNLVQRFGELTGMMQLPPRWALGYHQSRYSYRSREELMGIAREFRERKIPCDALYLDIDHMDGYRVFTFGKSFPQPKAMLEQLKEEGFQVTAIVDPGVKDDPQFRVLRRGLKADAFVKSPSGKANFKGAVWPGRSLFPDFTNAGARRWWGREQQQLLKLGIAGIWNDMNEPANFALETKTLKTACRHRTDFGPARHQDVHNVYGMQMARASFEGAQKFDPETRPFVITRAAYAGVQRYAMMWTGDNSSNWDHLRDSVQMILNLSLSGVPFCGADVGGFLDNATPELLIRWTQLASLTPFFRNHSNTETLSQEPWAMGEEAERICREFISLRYRLLPYFYSLFDEARRKAVPIVRPLHWHHPSDPIAMDRQDQFMLGPSLLIAPVLDQGTRARSVYLPKGRWYDFWSEKAFVGGRHYIADTPLDRMPIFVRAGSLLPLMPLRQFIGKEPFQNIDLHLWGKGEGEFDFYDDDGWSTAHSRGEYYRRFIRFQFTGKSGSLHFGEVEGDYTTAIKRWKIVLRGLSSKPHFFELKPSRGKTVRSTSGAARWCWLKNGDNAAAFEIGVSGG